MMSLGRAITVGVGVCLGTLLAQDCPAVASVLPNGTLAGTLDAASCQLGDRTPYAPYRLDLAVRGQIKLAVSGTTGDFSLTLRDASGIKVDSGASLVRPIEAGSYTLLVNGRAAGQTGSYTVDTSFTSEPGILCANFPNIGRQQTVQGKLPSSGCLALDGTPYEAYTLTTDGAGTLTVAASSQDFTPMVAVRSIDGYPLSPPSASPLNIALGGDSQYLLIISSADNSTGAYQIANTNQPADNETCRSQKALAASDSDSSAIGGRKGLLRTAGLIVRRLVGVSDLVSPRAVVGGGYDEEVLAVAAERDVQRTGGGRGKRVPVHGAERDHRREVLAAGRYRQRAGAVRGQGIGFVGRAIQCQTTGTGKFPLHGLLASDVRKVRAQNAGFAGERGVHGVAAGLAGRAAVYQQRVAACLDGADQRGAGIDLDPRSVAQRERKIPGRPAHRKLDLSAHRQVEPVRRVRGAVAELATGGIERAGESPIRENARHRGAVLSQECTQAHTNSHRNGASKAHHPP